MGYFKILEDYGAQERTLTPLRHQKNPIQQSICYF